MAVGDFLLNFRTVGIHDDRKAAFSHWPVVFDPSDPGLNGRHLRQLVFDVAIKCCRFKFQQNRLLVPVPKADGCEHAGENQAGGNNAVPRAPTGRGAPTFEVCRWQMSQFSKLRHIYLIPARTGDATSGLTEVHRHRFAATARKKVFGHGAGRRLFRVTLWRERGWGRNCDTPETTVPLYLVHYSGLLSDMHRVGIFFIVTMDSNVGPLRIERLNLPGRADSKCPWTRRRREAARKRFARGASALYRVARPGENRRGTDEMWQVRRGRNVVGILTVLSDPNMLARSRSLNSKRRVRTSRQACTVIRTTVC